MLFRILAIAASPSGTVASSPLTLSHPVLARGVVEALHYEVHDKLLANGYFNVSAERRTRSLWPLCRPKSWGPQVFPNKARCWEPAGRDAARQFTVADFRYWMWRYNLTTPAHLLLTDPSDPELYLLSPRRYTVYRHTHRGHRTAPRPAPRHESSSSVFCAEMVSHERGCGDLHNIPDALNPERDFDLVVFSQTMEHLYDPLLAARNLLRVMRPGGHLFTSAPVQSRPHMTPYHFFTYTPVALALVFVRAGFELVESGQWGNTAYLQILPDHWATPEDLAKIRGGTRNDPENPVQAWVLMRKPPVS